MGHAELTLTNQAVCSVDGDSIRLDAIPINTKITCAFRITVCAGETINNIAGKDSFSAELDVSKDFTAYGTEVKVGDHKGGGGATPVTWGAGTLAGTADQSCASLDLTLTTNKTPSGKQRYTSCGVVQLNSGGVATGTTASGDPISAGSNIVTGTVVATPTDECPTGGPGGGPPPGGGGGGGGGPA